MTLPSRRIATRAVSAGHWMSPILVPASGASLAMVSSTRLASLCRKVISRTRSPTLTASSTSAESRRGVETATSTPHDSLNSHSFLGWLMRATTLGTPYSVLASSDTTRLTLSSPVAAITTLQRCSAASSSEVISQASASSHSAWGTRSTEMEVGFLSISRTSWPFSSSSPAIERPTAPAPAMATLTALPRSSPGLPPGRGPHLRPRGEVARRPSCAARRPCVRRSPVGLLGPLGERGLDLLDLARAHHHVHQVAFLQD